MRFKLSTNSEEELIEHLGEEWEAMADTMRWTFGTRL